MDVDVLFSRPEDRDRVDERLIVSFLSWAAGQVAQLSAEHSMSLLIADEAEISRLHGEFFGDASVTDVVSFPAGDVHGDLDGYIGDVAVCLEVAGEQAGEAGHSVQREVMFLAVHGLLHLLGYDDLTDGERRRMLELQEALLTRFESEVRIP